LYLVYYFQVKKNDLFHEDAQIISMMTVFIAVKSDFVYDEFGTSWWWRRSL